jgi:hypothetical protein
MSDEQQGRRSDDASGSVEVGAGDKRLAIRGIRITDWVGIATVIAMTGVIIMVYDHRNDAKDAQAMFVQTIKEVSSANTSAIKELTIAQKEGNSVQREQTCLLQFAQTERQTQAQFCKQMGQLR